VRPRREQGQPAGGDVSAAGPILLVEDDEALVTVLSRHLRARGYDVLAVGSAEEAISRLIEGQRPALILLDINLPEDSGWGVLRSEAYAAAGSPLVVVVSATHVSPERLHEFHIAGHLPKPFALEALIATVERLTHEGEPPSAESATTGDLDVV